MEQVFDKAWFQKNQKKLLWFSNTPVVKIWFRWVLIKMPGFDEKYKIPLKENIVCITPNSIVSYVGMFWDKKNGIKPRLRINAHPKTKYAYRLRYAFAPLWMAMHIWDLLADPMVPALSFGFNSFTGRPVPGTTASGIISYSAALKTWAQIHDTAGNVSDDTADSSFFARIVSDNALNTFQELTASGFSIDVSAMGTNPSSLSMTFVVVGSDTNSNGLGGGTYNIYNFTPGSKSALANSDYGQRGTTAYATAIASASWSESGNNSFTVNSTGNTDIITACGAGGIFSLSGREAAHDAANTAPTWGNTLQNRAYCYFGSHTGTSSDPVLSGTFTPGTIAYTLTCAQGSYSLTGQTLGMIQALTMACAQGSYALTGIATVLNKGYTLVAAMGSYALTGIDLTMTKSLIISLAQGAYTLSGQALTLSLGLVMSCATGFYTLSGFILRFAGYLKRIKPSRGTYTPRTKPSMGSYIKRTKPYR